MTRATESSTGFDAGAHVARLRALLAGMDGERAGTAFEVAVAHIQSHPDGLCPRDVSLRRGGLGVARACGVALALYELAVYDAQREAAKPLIDLAREAAALHRELARSIAPFLAAARAHAPTAAAHHEPGEAVPLDAVDPKAPRPVATTHDCQARCEAPADAYRALATLGRTLPIIARSLPHGVHSPELAARARSGPGAERLILLRDVEGFLLEAGFSYAEVGDLIDDGGAPDRKLRAERVRFRAKHPPGADDRGE